MMFGLERNLPALWLSLLLLFLLFVCSHLACRHVSGRLCPDVDQRARRLELNDRARHDLSLNKANLDAVHLHKRQDSIVIIITSRSRHSSSI